MPKFAKLFDVGEEHVLFTVGHDDDGPFLKGETDIGMNRVSTKMYVEFNNQAFHAMEAIQQADAEGFYAEMQGKFGGGIVEGIMKS